MNFIAVLSNFVMAFCADNQIFKILPHRGRWQTAGLSEGGGQIARVSAQPLSRLFWFGPLPPRFARHLPRCGSI
jgi:hypothetical protein